MDQLHLIQTAPKHICPLRPFTWRKEIACNSIWVVFYGKMKKIWKSSPSRWVPQNDCSRWSLKEMCSKLQTLPWPHSKPLKPLNTSDLSQKTLTYLRVPSETSPSINGVSWQSPLHRPQRQRCTAIQDLATSHGLWKVQDQHHASATIRWCQKVIVSHIKGHQWIMNLWMLRIIHPCVLQTVSLWVAAPPPSSLPATTPPPLGHHPSLWLPPVLPAEPPHCLLMGEYYQSKAKEINFFNGFSTLIHQEKPFFPVSSLTPIQTQVISLASLFPIRVSHFSIFPVYSTHQNLVPKAFPMIPYIHLHLCLVKSPRQPQHGLKIPRHSWINEGRSPKLLQRGNVLKKHTSTHGQDWQVGSKVSHQPDKYWNWWWLWYLKWNAILATPCTKNEMKDAQSSNQISCPYSYDRVRKCWEVEVTTSQLVILHHSCT